MLRGRETVLRAAVLPVMRRVTADIHRDVVQAAPVQRIDPADAVRLRKRERRKRGPDKYGPFRETIEHDVDPDGTGYVWTESPLGHLIEFGTKPHEIRPRIRWVRGTNPPQFRGKGGLFWFGAAHPVERVRHPGATANPIFRRAAYQRRAAYRPGDVR